MCGLITRRKFVIGSLLLAGAAALHPLAKLIPGKKKTERRADALGKKKVEEILDEEGRITETTVDAIDNECCVDDRCTHDVAGVPGGSLGIMAAGLTTLWKAMKAKGKTLTPAMIQSFVDSYEGVIALHTDVHAEEKLAEALGQHKTGEGHSIPNDPLDPWSGEDLSDNHVLDLLIEHLGCGHIQQMLAHPDEYGTDAGLIREMLKAVFRRQKRDPNSVKKELLQTIDHKAKAVLVIRMKGGIKNGESPIAVVKPCHQGTQCFVKHEGLDAYLMETKILPALKKAGINVNESAFKEAAAEICDNQTDQTLSRLAAGLGIFIVEVNPKNHSRVVQEAGTVQAISI